MNKTAYTCAFTGLFCFCLLPLFGQTTFQKSYGNPTVQSEAKDVIESDEGYLVAGFTVNNGTGKDGLLIHLDFQGNVLWENTYDLSSVDEFKAVVRANDGGFVAMGIAESPNDLWLVKISTIGAIVWQKQFHRPNGGIAGFRIHALPNGYVLSGTEAPNAGGSSPFAIRIDNNGNVLWSKSYQIPSALMSIGYLTDSLWYAGGVSNFSAVFMALDPVSGNVVKSKSYDAAGTESLDYIAASSDGNLLLADYAQPFWPSNKFYPWVQKVTPAGDVLWSKIYNFSDQFQYNGPIISAADGGFLLCPGAGTNHPDLDAQMMKIDENGQVSWCYAFGKPNGNEWFLNAIQTSDGGFMAVGLTSNGIQLKNSVFVVKTDANGRVHGCCPIKKAVTVTDFTTNIQTKTYNAIPFIQGEQAFGSAAPRTPLPQTLDCNVFQPTLQIDIPLCSGETVTLAGQTYTQPDTVTLELLSNNGGCDTLATYILTDAALGQNSQVTLQCPANIFKTIPAGATSALISYAPPTAASNCTCPGLDIIKTSGADSGSSFPIGTSTVCWQGNDACGTTNTCCFTVSVAAETTSVCDTKTTTCLKWDLLSVKRNASNQRIYSIRLTNTCTAVLNYAYIGLPVSLSAPSPANNSVYTAVSGRQYEVRNPNFSPIYGLRFKSMAVGLNSGQSDEFHFTLPPQISLDYCYVAGRLDNGAFYEAYLNTFFCTVGIETAAGDRSSEIVEYDRMLEIAPNPAKAGSTLFLVGRSISSGEVLLTNVSGECVFRGKIADNQVFLGNDNLPEGIYFFHVFETGRLSKIGKLVLLR